MNNVEKNKESFENIKHIDENNVEFWYARELMLILQYKQWRRFESVIEKAKQALDAQILFCDDLHAEITAVLLSLEDPDDYEILKLRYLHFKTWESIAAEIKLCLRQIYRRHRRAIDELNL